MYICICLFVCALAKFTAVYCVSLLDGHRLRAQRGHRPGERVSGVPLLSLSLIPSHCAEPLLIDGIVQHIKT